MPRQAIQKLGSKMREPSYTYKAEKIRVIDGDTIDLRVDLGLRIFVEIRCRLFGINAPELSQPGGKDAKEALDLYTFAIPFLIIKTFKNPKDKYGRWLVLLYRDSLCINDDMVKKGLAEKDPFAKKV